MWKTKKGKYIPINKLRHIHLFNIVLMLEKRNEAHYHPQYKKLYDEFKNRGGQLYEIYLKITPIM